MSIEYLDNVEDTTDMPHEHICEECGITIIELCTDDCDDDTYEVCESCKEVIEDDNASMAKAIEGIEKENNEIFDIQKEKEN